MNISSRLVGRAQWVRRNWRSLICLVALQCGIVQTVVSADTSPVGTDASRFQRTVLGLESAPDEWRSEFADVALVHLAEIYLGEADLARSEREASLNAAKLEGWSRAVADYADQLILVQQDVEMGFPVEVFARFPDEASLRVAGRTVILNHPRASQQAAYEQGVLLDFCGRRDCFSLTAPDVEPGSVPEPIPVSAPVVTPQWHFTERGPVCSLNSFQLHFGRAADLTRARPLCTQLLQEMTILAMEIRWQQRHGVVANWDRIVIQAAPQRPRHMVILNEGGDTLLLSLPLLHAQPDLFKDIYPWLQAIVGGKKPGALTLEAATYGWNSAYLAPDAN
ncbi:MAG: hypothetical protein ABJ013_15345 [Halioglobus sp.]